MHVSLLKTLATLVSALALSLVLTGASHGQDSAGVGPHGGVVHMTKGHQFEVVFNPAGFKVYPQGMDGKPLDAAKLEGKATFYHPNSPEPWFSRPLGASVGAGRSSASLDCPINLSKAPSQGAKVVFEISGLPDRDEAAASFTVPFILTQPPAVAVVPRPAPAAITYAKAARADQPAVNAQKVCKVSGESLGSMGIPLKVTRGDGSVFLCCRSCLAKVTANPDHYLGGVR